MSFGRLLNRLLSLLDLKLTRLPAGPRRAYDQDGLTSFHNHDFIGESDFSRAYARGVEAAGSDYRWHWRVHVALWVAHRALDLAGDFVECGVNRGFLSSAIMQYLDWNRQERDYYLLDTFSGLDERYVSRAELDSGILRRNQEKLRSGFYVDGVDAVRENFSEWPRARLVVGSIPESLPQVVLERVAFLHLDLNCSPPEIAALDHFWPSLSPGAFVLLDDYGYAGFETQRAPMDDWARDHRLSVLSLPTGQGLIQKPHRQS
ncbi:MAG: class I SAM-dependent methyltransferase [Acidobacteria bacterium]|nr:MAG: class I SAM-dependent methyltransferase [Acidobacteriota bacterium]REK09790.1 MAG: class I SAM-dependent methyltransferase [Acidobacteriota bacterium]